MILGTIVKTSFVAGIILTIAGAYLRIKHSDSGDSLLIIGLLASVVFIVSAIYEVRSSKQLTSSEKTVWTLGLLFFSGIVGLVYVLLKRNSIVGNG